MHHAIKHIARLRLLREFCARFAFSCALAALLAAPAAQAELPMPPAAFDKGSTITVAGYAGSTPLADFPVLVRIAENSPSGFSYDDLQSKSTGADIAFVDMSGNGLPFEIDTWNPSGTSLIWVRLPSMTNGTEFAMFWGSDAAGKTVCPDNPWVGYTGVWHMGDPGDGVTNVLDSTANHLDGTTVTSSKAVSDGKIGGARFITSNTSNTAGQPYDSGVTVDLADADKLAAVDAIVPEFTASFWVRPQRDTPQWWYFITRKASDYGPGWGLQQGADNDWKKYRAYGGEENDSGCLSLSDVTGLSKGSWTKVDAVWMSDKTFKIYMNGSFAKDGQLANLAANGDQTKLALGGALASTDMTKKNGRGVYGDMDEIRLRPGAASPDWIAADYATQTSASFLTMAPAENVRPPVEPVFSSVAFASAAETTASFSVAVRRIGEGAASAALSAVVREAGAAAASTNAVETLTTAGTFSETLTGLAPATAYEVFFRLENEVDGVTYATESETLSFETAAIDKNPTVSLSLSRVYAAAADLEVSVPRFGYGASSLSSLSLSYGTDPADESGWTTVALAPPAAEGGTVAHRLVGLRTGATYYAKVVAANDLEAPGSFTTPVLSFTPAGSGSVGGGADESVPQLADYRVASGENTVAVSARVAGLGFGGASASLRFRVAETREGLDAAAWTDGAADLAVGDAVAFGAGELDGFATAWVETEIRNDLGAAWTYRGVADVAAPTFEPAVSLVLTDLSATSAVLSVAVESFGYRATRLDSLVLAWGTDEADESGWTAIPLAAPAAEGGSVAVPLVGLAEGTTYYAKATAVNDLAEPRSADATLSFTPFEPTTFLQKLATHASHVAASPYATGGDVILRLGDGDYVHVFTNTAAAATFTPVTDLRARVLVVAGGGAAGSVTQSPGGGGAGGMVEESGVALAADTPYTATVGAGGAATASQNGNKNGDNSSFVGGSVSLTAIGGGRGSDWGANNAKSGGSGGGAGSGGIVTSGGAGTAGQGYEGGGVLASPYNVGGGGGGGAGAPGGTVMIYASESPLGAIHGGLGGDGLSSDILGFEQYFAGGGGGYYNKTAANGCIRSPGGLGGGGSGGISDDTAGENGEDGLGGGGGGGLAKAASGRGGSGIVVVRYVVWTDSAPLLRASTATAKGGSFATVAGALGAYGKGESSAAVKMRYWKTSAPAETAVATVLELEGNDALDAAFEKTVGGFEPETEYRYALYAEGANGSSAEQTGSFTTFSTSIGSAASGGEASVVDGVDRVHVFTEDGTFTATGSGYAEILVVGGGGAGGSGGGPGGGGGGGGVVHATKVLLEPGVYAVTIGAGGTMASSATSSKTPGGNSLITSEGGAITNFIAYGGGCGVGWDDNTVTGSSGASGGGGARNKRGTEALPVYGQGHVGGDPQNDYRPGGGGGAGTKGANGSASGVTPSGAGAGGAGLAFSITGTRVVYGSGGGGGARSNADVMAPGGENGGNGAYWTVPATAGVDGTGGGGGGCNASAATRIAGNGGSGVVIIRYTDFSLAGDAPVLAVHPDDATVAPCSVVLPIDVTSAGTGASTVSLTAAWGYAADDLSVGSTALSDFIGSGEISAAGLLPGTEYFFSIVADNGQSGGTATWTGSFTTAAMFSEPLAYTAAGGVLGYTVDGAATADSQRLELWVGPDASSMTNQATYADASLMTAGTHTIQPFTTEQFGTDAAILLRHIALVDGIAFTNDTAVLSTTIQDGATYTWKSDVAEGDWCDAANWTASTTPGRGWPTVGSTAKFPNAVVTCRVDRAVSFSTARFDGGTWSFAGTMSGASLSFGGSGDPCLADGSYRFDALALRVKAGQNGWLGNNQRIVLENGAELVSSKNLCLRTAGGSLLIGAGCSFAGNGLGGSKGAALVVSNGTATVSGAVNLSERGSAADLPASLSICGADARISCNGFYSQYTNATVTIELEGTYSSTEALIRGTGTEQMAKSGYALTFDVPKTSASKKVAKCDILVADWSKKSINTALVEFGEVDREGSYFYFTETADPKGTQYKSAEEVTAAGATVKYLWYHHAPPSGMVIIVR